MWNHAVNRKCGYTFGFPLQAKYSFVILDKNYAKPAGGIYCSKGKKTVVEQPKQHKNVRIRKQAYQQF